MAETERREEISNVKNKGASDSRFFKGDFPTGDEYTDEEKLEFFKQRKYALINMNIKANSGNIPFTLLEDVFTLHLEHGKERENVDVITKKLQNIILQINVLIERWTEEMNK